jgi:hypothetical protein
MGKLTATAVKAARPLDAMATGTGCSFWSDRPAHDLGFYGLKKTASGAT